MHATATRKRLVCMSSNFAVLASGAGSASVGSLWDDVLCNACRAVPGLMPRITGDKQTKGILFMTYYAKK